MTTRNIQTMEFDTAEELIEAMEILRRYGKDHRLTIKDADGVELTNCAIVEETLSDGSLAFCFVLSRTEDEDEE